jgi:hypothetical protein
MTALKRHLERDPFGDLNARWDDNGKDDHFAHAELYALLAEKSYLKQRGGDFVVLDEWRSVADPPGYREDWRPDFLGRRW